MILKSVILAASFIAHAVVGQTLPLCRILPGDSSWPTQDVWDAFNNSIDGRVIKTVPIGSVCHDPSYDEEQCNVVRSNWRNPAFHEPHPSSIMDPIFLNKTCDPFDPREAPCEIGAYVQYAVNVSSPDHVIKTVQFVKEHNIRFVVKNTGHDYEGRSTGTAAVSVWMHHLQDIEFIPDFKSSSYAGPAFKVHAGVLGINLAKEASQRGLVIVSGECPTVGFAGGYIQGGGHSALSSLYGMAADHTLEFEVITAQGEFVNASPTENQDLYWALSGGGGGTYGIVWSVTVKPHQDLPVTIGSVNFTSNGIDEEVFWQALDAYQASTPNFTDAKIWGVAQYSTDGFSLYPVFAVNKTTQEVSALLQPFLSTLDGLGVQYVTGLESYDRYVDAYTSIGMFVDFAVANVIMGSRLLPRSLFEDRESLNEVSRTVRSLLEGGTAVFEFIMRATSEVAGNPQNAVLPAWRDAERHFVFIISLEDGEPAEQILRDQDRITNEFMPMLKKLSPGSGAYGNEADPYDPDFKVSLYGSNYDKLLAIKDKYDPDQILYGTISVGGDRWRQTEEGRLCRTQ
ncbi:FAD-binding domain-containing protein [Marasmius fiardii PR-910]|nr:FAD-binding domain-containing protein [Marasmius fiardii PR-910]